MASIFFKLFAPIGAYFVRLRHRMAVDQAKCRVERSDQAVKIWREHIQNHVFKDVSGEGVLPYTVNGTTLEVHLFESFVGSVDTIEFALCSDHKDRWYKLYGVPGTAADLTRINSKQAKAMLASYQDLVALAATPTHVDLGMLRSCNVKTAMRLED